MSKLVKSTKSCRDCAIYDCETKCDECKANLPRDCDCSKHLKRHGLNAALHCKYFTPKNKDNNDG